MISQQNRSKNSAIILLFLTYVLLIASSSSAADSKAEESITVKKTADSTTATANSKKKSQDITDTITYESENINYDAEAKVLQLTGKAVVKYQKLTLQADTIIYTINENLFTATGMPQLIDGTDTTIGDFMAYNIKTRRGRVRYASTHLNDGYFNGQRIIKSDKNELYVDQGDYTTCADIDTPHYFFYGRKIKVVPNDKILGRPIIFNIGDAPVAVLPFFIFPIEKKRRSGFLTPSFGGNFSNGGYIDNIGYYLSPNDYMDFMLKTRISEFQDYLIEGSSRYALKYRLSGSITASYAKSTKFLSAGNEWAINYNHNQNITPDGRTQLSGTGRLTSSNKFYTDNSEIANELVNQNLSANMSLSHRFESINASTNLTWNREHNLKTDYISEGLPSFSFNLPSRALIPLHDSIPRENAHWFNNIFYSYNTNAKVLHVLDPEKDTAFHPGMSHSLNINSSQTLFKHITLTPSFSARYSGFYGYKDTTILGYDTTYSRDTTVSILTSSPFKENIKYSETEYPIVKIDTVVNQTTGLPDTIKIKRLRKTIRPIQNTFDHQYGDDANWNASLGLSTNFYGIFPVKILNFAGLRHTLTPTIQYTFSPEHKQEKEFYNLGSIPFDRDRERSQTVAISLGNRFDGKIQKQIKGADKPEIKTFPLLTVNMSTGYDFEKDSCKWSDLSLTASTAVKGLNINYNSTFWLYNNSRLSVPIMKNMDVRLTTGTLSAKGHFWGGDLLSLDSLDHDDHTHSHSIDNSTNAQTWQVSLSPSYQFSLIRSNPTELFTPTKNYGLSASANLNFSKNWSMRWNGNYSFNDDQWTQNSFTFGCDLECWEMHFEWRPERLNPGYYFKINIKKLPEIKWEQKQ